MTSSDGPADATTEPFPDWRLVGESRGYEYHERVAAPKLRGMLFREGDDVVAERVIDALQSPTPFLAGYLVATYGQHRTRVRTAFVAIPLARSMPSAVLVNARSDAFRDAGISMGSRQLVQLQGDFDRSFSLYCPIGGAAQALQVFSPELMRLFLDGASDSDIEIVDTWMFVYGTANSDTSADLLDRIEKVALSVNVATRGPSFEGVLGLEGAAGFGALGAAGVGGTRGAPADGAVEPPRKASGRTLLVVSLVAVVVGVLFSWWGSQLY